MARFAWHIPNDVLKDFERIHNDSERIFGAMTKAGAEAVADNVRANAPIRALAEGVKVSRTYKTPSDDGINTKVYISGTVKNSLAFTRRGRVKNRTKYTTYKGVPLEFIAKIYEYGTAPRFTDSGAYRGYIGKKPFFRKGFRKDQIEKIMLKVQKIESGGLLE